MSGDSYMLGHHAEERERLVFQDEVWVRETEDFLDRLGIAPGSRVLELGCGIGLGLPRLARRVGPGGRVIGWERNRGYAEESRRLIEGQGLSQVELRMGDLERDPLPEGPFDAIYARWVFSYLPRVATVLAKLRPLLAPHGRLGILDYNHDSIRVFPKAPEFAAVIEAVRKWFAVSGGDCWVTGFLPGYFAETGYALVEMWSYSRAGPPRSPVYRWVEEFLFVQGPAMIRAGVLSQDDWGRFRQEWETMAIAPDTVLFSPLQVGVIGRVETP
ncbi:MAG: methyltransferase domain-containing protein [Armatimonadetes bacterium]|nr:methyltransferase domain-containing protein [Armatimonadota bacterium]